MSLNLTLTLDESDALLAEFPMSADGTGHIADCGFDEQDMKCECMTLRARLASAVAPVIERHVAAALENAASALDDIAATNYGFRHESYAGAAGIVRAHKPT